ncbi:hypothetical protein BOTBODRAFT_413897 [Botryobasidium botryosum FD-172 SS1]|uniref:Uncharacterized protein n=1 Tax=Botryobasidium botryosum (strain FD-172 SS1) TaxID=930990 RepID=A0A067MAM8_BOTB1|nr:hypothetical protein BOTBODRAFT_413897 [Botryobasidium botryosum FD-172 SS1]
MSTTSRSMLEAMGLFPRDPGECELPWIVPPHAVLRCKSPKSRIICATEDLHQRVMSLHLPLLHEASLYTQTVHQLPPRLETLHGALYELPDDVPDFIMIYVPRWEIHARNSLERISSLFGWPNHPCPVYTPQPFNFFGVKSLEGITSTHMIPCGHSVLLLCLLALQPVLDTLKEMLTPPGDECRHEFTMCLDHTMGPTEVFVRHRIKPRPGEEAADDSKSLGILICGIVALMPENCKMYGTDIEADEAVLEYIIRDVGRHQLFTIKCHEH